jgi:hypothetical protein
VRSLIWAHFELRSTTSSTAVCTASRCSASIGEFAYLRPDERDEVARVAVDQVARRVPVMAGVSPSQLPTACGSWRSPSAYDLLVTESQLPAAMGAARQVPERPAARCVAASSSPEIAATALVASPAG